MCRNEAGNIKGVHRERRWVAFSEGHEEQNADWPYELKPRVEVNNSLVFSNPLT